MDMLAGMRDQDMTDEGGRLKTWVQAMNPLQSKFIEKMRPDIASCLSPDWYTWHSDRLRLGLALEWAYQKAKSGEIPTIKRASHDFHDMQYVTYLSRADGLLTKDNDCRLLAKAAFPDKDVFSSLDEVPAEYVCNRR